MGNVGLGMTMSLDGFINDQHGSVARLYPDLDELRNAEPLQESIRTTGAVVMGWNAFAMAEDPDSYAGNYEFQVPIFVLTHEPPKKQPKETEDLTFTFVMDGIESAIKQAKAAAGGQDVTIIGDASVARPLTPGLWTNSKLILCQFFFLMGCGFLKIFIWKKCNWND
jgi:dihydrofolate reductase